MPRTIGPSPTPRLVPQVDRPGLPWPAAARTGCQKDTLNLKNAAYCQTVYQDTAPHSLAPRLADVDPRLPSLLMKAWRRDRLTIRIPRKLESITNLPERLRPVIATAAEGLSK